MCGARSVGAVARTSSRRDASSHRRLEPAPAQGRARKHRAHRQWSQRRRPRLSTTPQSGQVKRGGAMVFGLYLFQSFVSVAQQNACWRAVQGCGPIPVVTPGAAVARAIPNWCQEPDNVVCVAVMKRCTFYKRGGRAVLRSPSLNSFEFQGVFGRLWLRLEMVEDRQGGETPRRVWSLVSLI